MCIRDRYDTARFTRGSLAYLYSFVCRCARPFALVAMALRMLHRDWSLSPVLCKADGQLAKAPDTASTFCRPILTILSDAVRAVSCRATGTATGSFKIWRTATRVLCGRTEPLVAGFHREDPGSYTFPSCSLISWLCSRLQLPVRSMHFCHPDTPYQEQGRDTTNGLCYP